MLRLCHQIHNIAVTQYRIDYSLCLGLPIQLLSGIGDFSCDLSCGFVSTGFLLLFHPLCIGLGFSDFFLDFLTFCRLTNILACIIFTFDKLANQLNRSSRPLDKSFQLINRSRNGVMIWLTPGETASTLASLLMTKTPRVVPLGSFFMPIALISVAD